MITRESEDQDDVNQALMSVARIFDAGHSVVFNPEGGDIRKNKTGDETKVAGFEDEDFEEIACEEMESEEAKPPDVIRRSTASHTDLSNLTAHIVLLGRPKIALTRRGKIRARSTPRSCSNTASWAVRIMKCMWYQEKGWYMSMGMQRWSAISRGWATWRSS